MPSEQQHRLSILVPGPIYTELRRRADHESNSVSSVARRLMADAVSADRTANGETSKLEERR